MAASRKLNDQEREIRKLQALLLTDSAQVEVDNLPGSAEVAKFASAVTTKMILMVLDDRWEIPNAEVAMKVAKLGFDIARIQQGLPTSISAPADREALKKLQADVLERKKTEGK